MKIDLPLAVFVSFIIIQKVNSGAIKAPLNIITLDDISESERYQIEEFNRQYERSKRSGSGSPDLLTSLKNLLAQGAKAKLKLLGRASAAASSAASSSIVSSSSGGKTYPSHGSSYGHSYSHPPEPSYDVWSMKRAVFNTLLQAVKAIKGGVLALKGQLIKGGGYLLVGGGKLVKAKGDVITNLGKKIARSAFRDLQSEHSSEVHEEVSYGHYHPSDVEYGPPPSDHFHHVEFPASYPNNKAAAPQSGILILKKIPSTKKGHLQGAESQTPIFQSVHPESNFGSIVGKFFSAASSLSPDSPVPFTDDKLNHQQSDENTGDGHEQSDDSDQQYQGHVSNYEYMDPYFK